MPEGYKVLAGKFERDYSNHDNMMLPAWKALSATHGGSKRPSPIIQSPMPFRQPLAQAIQELVRYRVQAFDYTALVQFCGMDSFFQKCGVGYARHSWDEAKGITKTSRQDPKNIFWDYNACSFDKASHVIERHVIPRWEFIKKFGAEKGWEVDAHKDSAVTWPKDKREHNGKSKLDQIEYFLMWSKLGGYKRVYAFTTENKKDIGVLNKHDGEPGEPWPIDLADDDWHLTPLAFTPIPGSIDAVSTYFAGKGQYAAYQRINNAVVNSNLKCGKGFLFIPDELFAEAGLIEQADKTVNIISYLRDEVGGKIDEWIKYVELAKTPDTLLQGRAEAKANWRSTVNVNAAQQIEAQQLETATEAKTMQDSAANMLASDQEAVERFITEIFRKEIFSDLSKMPKRSVVCVKLPDAKEKEEGEFQDDPEDYVQEEGEEYLTDVPYEDAIKLEKGPASTAAVMRIAKAREKVGEKAAFDATMNGVPPEQLEQVEEQAQQQVAQTPEMEVRVRYDVPMDAVCKIVNPGVEQFIGPEAAEGWVEGLPARQIKAEIGVSVEPGSSSATGRMQNMNEALMTFNTLGPICQQLGLDDQFCALANAVLDKTENPMLAQARFTVEKVKAAREAMQQAAMQAEQAAAEAKAKASQGPTEINPNDQIKADAEKSKAAFGLETQKEKTVQQQLKLEGDQARERTRSMSQLQMGMMP
jgi:hypothetical protein